MGADGTRSPRCAELWSRLRRQNGRVKSTDESGVESRNWASRSKLWMCEHRGMVEQPVDFFVSYTQADRPWAEWIAWQLEAANYGVIIQAWDFRPGQNWPLRMRGAAEQAERTLAVISPAFFTSGPTAAEWAAVFADDVTGTNASYVPVRVRECEIPKLTKGTIYIDLVGLELDAAKKDLLAGIVAGRVKPEQ